MATNAQILVSACISVIKYSFGSMTGRSHTPKKGNSLKPLVLKYDLLQVQKNISGNLKIFHTESFESMVAQYNKCSRFLESANDITQV